MGARVTGVFLMAENESLDPGKARRWRRVLRAVEDGKGPEAIAELTMAPVATAG